MRHTLVALLLTAAVWGTTTSAQAPQQAIDNAVAFARLYGVVRYFYPSDASASLDWNRFAVHGAKQIHGARDVQALEAVLQRLFSPLGPGIEISQHLASAPALGSPDHRLVAWRYLGAGMAGSGVPGPYRAKRTHRSLVVSPGIDGFATVMQTVPTQNLRGKTIRLRGLVRAASREATAGAALWLRVDRPNQQMGFFENMANRPIRDPDWKEHAIEGPVADDATSLAFGVMASGDVTADFDTITLAVRAADGRWTPMAVDDGGFEAATDAGTGGWRRAGTSKNVEVTRPTDRAPEGRQFLRLSPMSSPASSGSSLDELFDSQPRTGAHVDIDLGAGLKARVPTALSEAQAIEDVTRSSPLAALRAAMASVAESGDPPDLNTRIADVVVAWNVFRHFSPYWPESGVDWDGRLRSQLARVYDATTRAAHRDAMRLLVADARDGHGVVVDTRSHEGRGVLPVRLGVIEDQIVVTATEAPAEAPIGAVLSTVDGVPAAQRLAEAMRLTSGTTQWKQARALQEIATCPIGTVVTLMIDAGAGANVTSVPCEAKQAPAEKRPELVTEVTSGIWYVDLTRARMAQITPVLDRLAVATAVVFDLRGYPTDAGAEILPHLIGASEADRWMHVNKMIGPYGESAGWESFGWNLTPQSPRVGGKIVFLTDGRAISYAESVLGYVADRKLGTIVGSATAGANGNVAAFVAPGGFRIQFTGMRVTGHDGHTPHHLVGVQPDVPMAPTLAGLRAGRDDVLDRALALIRGQ